MIIKDNHITIETALANRAHQSRLQGYMGKEERTKRRIRR